MDIGVPYRVLGPVNVSNLIEFVRNMREGAWSANTFRQDVLADKAHA